MSDLPTKKARISEKQHADQSPRTPSSETEASSQRFKVESESGPREGSVSLTEASTYSTDFLQDEDYLNDCMSNLKDARQRCPSKTMNNNFVEELSKDLIRHVHQKIYTTWASLFSSDQPSCESSDEGALLPSDESKETSLCSLTPKSTASIARTSSITDIVCQELDNLRSFDHAAEQSDDKVMTDLSRNNPISETLSPESQGSSSISISADPTPPSRLVMELTLGEIPDPMELIMRLLDFSVVNLSEIEKRIAYTKQCLQRPLPVITSTSPEQVTTELMKPEPNELDVNVELLQRFRDSLLLEFMKLSNRLKILLTEKDSDTDSSSAAVDQLNSDSTTEESTSSKIYQTLNEDSTVTDINRGKMEVIIERDTSEDVTSSASEAKAVADQDLAKEGERSTGSCKLKRRCVPSDSLNDVPSLSFDSVSSEVEPLPLDSPFPEDETEQ